jgi:hypothetical protein
METMRYLTDITVTSHQLAKFRQLGEWAVKQMETWGMVNGSSSRGIEAARAG